MKFMFLTPQFKLAKKRAERELGQKPHTVDAALSPEEVKTFGAIADRTNAEHFTAEAALKAFAHVKTHA